ncbi:ubiquitin-like protein [Paecilomyces variotii No. 5]|uniref:Ubiquitin-like modifier HUB1 n=1 Tax=Byssochlamys spectabilis (strain No. 5 / NBRC 109023) TaxID=1356009 RepID=V5FCG8_BYSSN|nr:ubiquitin-like protein [Paecilomyces variotii No. 5]
MEERRRSRSPRRGPEGDRERPRKSHGGFRWKEKRRDDGDRYRDDRTLERGYRDRDDRGSSRRDGDDGRPGDRRRDGDRDRFRRRDNGYDSRDRPSNQERGQDRDRKREKKEKKPAPAATSSEEFIIVHVNDRLGTKAAIPCLPSDPIKLFKAQVAARIGREPHEILLKRQGERPFKDQLTLEDYGVSNGVQLDLEVDTGD